MIVEVLGIKRYVSFTPKESSEKIEGSNIFVKHLENGVEGYMCEKFFLNAKTFDSSVIKVGDELDLQFNRYGKVANFTRLDSKK